MHTTTPPSECPQAEHKIANHPKDKLENSTSESNIPSVPNTANSVVSQHKKYTNIPQVRKLNDAQIYVQTQMKNLSNAGYKFTTDEIDKMCSLDWSQSTFNLTSPFMRRFVRGVTTHIDENNHTTYYRTIFTFNKEKVLINFDFRTDAQIALFDHWYNSLDKKPSRYKF